MSILINKNPLTIECKNKNGTYAYVLCPILDEELIQVIKEENLEVGTDLNKWLRENTDVGEEDDVIAKHFLSKSGVKVIKKNII